MTSMFWSWRCNIFLKIEFILFADFDRSIRTKSWQISFFRRSNRKKRRNTVSRNYTNWRQICVSSISLLDSSYRISYNLSEFHIRHGLTMGLFMVFSALLKILYFSRPEVHEISLQSIKFPPVSWSHVRHREKSEISCQTSSFLFYPLICNPHPRGIFSPLFLLSLIQLQISSCVMKCRHVVSACAKL